MIKRALFGSLARPSLAAFAWAVALVGCGGDEGDNGNPLSPYPTNSAMPTMTDGAVPGGTVPGGAGGPAVGPMPTDGGPVPTNTTGVPLPTGLDAPTATATATATVPDPDIDDPATSCEETAPIGQRVIRLNYNQLAKSFAAYLGPEAIASVALDDPRHREFQPLFSGEGSTITTPVLQKSLEFARAAADSIVDRFEAVTGCTTPATDACAQAFLSGLASEAFRRPVTAEEVASIDVMYLEMKDAGNTVEESTRYSAQGILLSPASLYRTEFGVAGGDPGVVTLDPYEMASALSYFLLDKPPTDALLAAASDGSLGTAAGIQAQVDALLLDQEVRDNLTGMMMAYYRLGDIDEVIKSETVFPADVFNVGMRNAMYTETRMFLEHTLWNGTIPDLLTSRTTFVNEPLALHYGIAYPAVAGGDPAQDFVQVQLPEAERSGILTQASIMTMRSVPDTTSVVGRGLFVNSAFLCLQRPPAPPTDPANAALIEEQANDAEQTEREKSDYRTTTVPCSTCHLLFDAYGLVLENYDAIGRYRTTYDDGMAIDPAAPTPVTLIGAAQGKIADVPSNLADASALIGLMDDAGLFAHCTTANMLKYAAAAPIVDAKACVVSEVDTAFQTGEPTFANLIRQVALSPVMGQRSVEAAQ